MRTQQSLFFANELVQVKGIQKVSLVKAYKPYGYIINMAYKNPFGGPQRVYTEFYYFKKNAEKRIKNLWIKFMLSRHPQRTDLDCHNEIIGFEEEIAC